jgi:transposase-like protein
MKHWCLTHRANATGFKGVRLDHCVASADEIIGPRETLVLDPASFPGGVALWGAVPAVFDTTSQIPDRGIHVHARRSLGGPKAIDRTYRCVTVRAPNAQAAVEIGELDAIYYMVSLIFGHGMKTIACTLCGHLHLDKDWFAVHAHQRHLCAGCGRHFSDSERHIGNPVMTVKALFDDPIIARATRPADRTVSLRQKDFPLGIQIWGSNQAIVWTSTLSEEHGIHLHAYDGSQAAPQIDDTFDAVTIDGVALDPVMIRTLMAQFALPHLRDRVVSLHCTACGMPHFDIGEKAYTPHAVHDCESCGATFSSPLRLKNTISNPVRAVLTALERSAPLPRQNPLLPLRPETI